MSACGPLLLEGGVWGGREEQCSTYLFYMLRPFLFRYHPSPLALRREWGFAPLCGAAATSVAALKAPVAPEEGTTLGANLFERAKRLEPLRSSFERSFAALNSALRAVIRTASGSNQQHLGSRGHPSSRRNLLSAD